MFVSLIFRNFALRNNKTLKIMAKKQFKDLLEGAQPRTEIHVNTMGYAYVIEGFNGDNVQVVIKYDDGSYKSRQLLPKSYFRINWNKKIAKTFTITHPQA